jgi:adiponectin receptor
MMFVSLGLSGVVPIFHALRIYGYQGLEDRASVSWVVLQGGLYIFGAVLYAVSWDRIDFHDHFHIC